jgi:hypothetical protein
MAPTTTRRHFMGGGWAGFKSPEVVIDGANDNQLVVGTNTLAAKYAFTQVPDYKRICLLKTHIMGYGIKTDETHAQFRCDLP